MDGERQGGATYAAFISYSHKDAAFGRWLHRKLEGYRLPHRLAGSEGERGRVPARLTPIFRDREELPAAGDLSERVRAALSVSGSLIVVCSPDAAASPWVAKEIATFHALHPDRPVLAAIAEGEPAACFPPSIRRGADGEIEPLAADFRKDRDGRRLALLKLVAGIAGVGLDQLVQRDAQRRIRRVTAVTLAAVLGMLVTAALAIVAVNARAEAQRQRAEAEGLVEFMLTDLRDRLKGVGRLDVLTAVNQRALRYYGTRSDLVRLSDESLARRARIFEAMAQDDLARNRPEAALAAFREASRTTGEQLKRAPTSPQRISAHSRVLAGMGKLHQETGDWKKAALYFAAISDLSEKLLTADPDNPEYAQQAAVSAIDAGNINLLHTYEFADAESYYRKGLQLLERSRRLGASNRHTSLATVNTLGYLADTFYCRRLWSQSLALRRRQMILVTALLKSDGKDMEARYYLATSERGYAYSLWRTGQQKLADFYIKQSQQDSDALVAADHHNSEWERFQHKVARGLQEPSKCLGKSV